jgi:hypothetical protein
VVRARDVLKRYLVYEWDHGLFGKVPLDTEWDSG